MMAGGRSGFQSTSIERRSTAPAWSLVALLTVVVSPSAQALPGAEAGSGPPPRSSYLSTTPAPGVQGMIRLAQARSSPLVAPVRPPAATGRELPVPGALPPGAEQPGIIRKRVERLPGAPLEQRPATGGEALPQAMPRAMDRPPGARSVPLSRGREALPDQQQAAPPPGVATRPSPRMIIIDDFEPARDPITKQVIPRHGTRRGTRARRLARGRVRRESRSSTL